MENILAKLALAIATLTASIMALFSGPSPEAPSPTPAPEVVVVSEEEPAPTVTAPAPKITEVNSYEIGRQVGYIEAIAEVVAEEAKKQTPPIQDEPEVLPTNNQNPMTEENTTAEAPVSQARIKLFSSDSATGMGREYSAITDPTIERWDQASDNSNIVVIDLIVFNEEGKKDTNVDVKVTASDESQSKQLGGKQSYQYLFKTPGDHTITFEAYGVTESVTFNAK